MHMFTKNDTILISSLLPFKLANDYTQHTPKKIKIKKANQVQ